MVASIAQILGEELVFGHQFLMPEQALSLHIYSEVFGREVLCLVTIDSQFSLPFI